MPSFPSMSSSTSSKTRNRPNGLDKAAKSANNISMSLRSISKMGNSMTALLPNSSESISEKSPDKPLAVSQLSNKQYEQAEQTLYSDILQVRKAMDLFLSSRIPEAQEILEGKRRETMYHSIGYSFILFLKSMMTFQQSDIESAIDSLKETIQITDSLRQKGSSWLGNITSWVKGSTIDIKSMSRLHRHAELVYAEAYLLKALLSIIHDESFVSFLREGLHVRQSYNTYKLLEKFMEQVRMEALEGKDVSAYELDDHFTSGVALGIGLFNIMISLLPTSVLKVAQFIGFTNDRPYGMEMLESVGGWEEYSGLPLSELPSTQDPDEGLRRQFCDMTLLMYHIIMSKLVPLSDVNEELAERVLAYNLTLYPTGVFFLYFSGRQLESKGQLSESKSQYQMAIDTQKDWKQLQHMCFWELGLINLLQQDWKAASDCYTTLYAESNWSKAVYTYLQAISLFLVASEKDQEGSEEQKEHMKEAVEMMKKVNGSKQKIAGKSIPLEKFIARKARKFLGQNNRLLFPDLEALNAFSAFDFMSIELLHHNLDRISTEIDRLTKETTHQEALNYYDDISLCHYLRTMVLRLLIVQVKEGDQKEWERLHKESIDFVMENADKIQLDHYIYYFARYEEARMLIIRKEYDQAKEIIQSLIKCSEKNQFNIGAGPHAKNKYSLENTLLFKCHGCLTEIQSLSE
ncbi:hypothetical protein K501DRAFT_206052, partial [Backusella circina FSU 941]